MMKIQQTAACAICQHGVQDGPDKDDYTENWKQWHEHLLALEEASEPWRLWKRKEPIVTHQVEGSDMVHWLCRECVYRHDPANGRFSVQRCPICRSDLNIPGREAGVEADMHEYAHENPIDTFEFDHLDLGAFSDNSMEDEGEEGAEVSLYVAGYRQHDTPECILASEVMIQNAARAAGQDITSPCVFKVFTRDAPYTICGADRRNWGLLFLIHSVDILQRWNDQEGWRVRLDEAAAALFVPWHDWGRAGLPLFDHAAVAGRFILAEPRYFDDGRIGTPLLDFSHVGQYAAQIQDFKDELRPGNISPRNIEHHEHNAEIYASASVFFLLAIIPDLFAADQRAVAIFNDGQLLQLQARYHLLPPGSSKREYVEEVLITIDNIIQQYNELVYPHLVDSHESVMQEQGGMVQDILAPRPWVIMQIIQMYVHDDEQGSRQSRCVCRTLATLLSRNTPVCHVTPRVCFVGKFASFQKQHVLTFLVYVHAGRIQKKWSCMTVCRVRVDFRNRPITHPYPHMHSNQWMSGVRVAYVDLSLVRRPSMTREEWAANVVAFGLQMDNRSLHMHIHHRNFISDCNVSVVTKLLIAFAADDTEGHNRIHLPGAGIHLNLASVVLPRNELIFEGIKFG